MQETVDNLVLSHSLHTKIAVRARFKLSNATIASKGAEITRRRGTVTREVKERRCLFNAKVLAKRKNVRGSNQKKAF